MFQTSSSHEAAMASPSKTWMQEYNEALKLADQINTTVSNSSSLALTGPQTHRQFFAATRRKITILKTKLEGLEILRSQFQNNRQPITQKEMNKYKEMLEKARTKVKQLEETFNSYSAARRDRLLGHCVNSNEIMKKVADMDNHGVVDFQRQIMKVQYEELGKLEEIVVSTKHIALAVNEELGLQTRLLDTLDDHVESTGSRLHRIQKRLAFFNKSMKGGGCSYLCFAAVLIVILILITVALIKNL